MSTFIFAFFAFLILVIVMAVGYIIQQKTISGSCGGLGSVGIDKVCSCPEPCDRQKARMEREATRQKKLDQWQQDKII